MKQNLDLSTVNAHSMVAILEANKEALWKCETKDSLFATVKNVFKDNKLDTPASRRLLLNISKQSSLTSALTVVTNSMLCGYGLGL